TCRVSSTPSPAEVMMASVVSGVISETDPTSVVLPTPKPPAITIFAEVTRPECGRCAMSELAKSTQHPLQQFSTDRVVVVVVERGRFVHRHETLGGHVGDQYPGDAERQLHPCRDLGERLEPPVAQRRDVLLLPAVLWPVRPHRVPSPHGCLDECFQSDLQPGPGATAGDGVRPDQRTRWLVAFGHHRRSPPLHRSRPDVSWLFRRFSQASRRPAGVTGSTRHPPGPPAAPFRTPPGRRHSCGRPVPRTMSRPRWT